MGAQLHAAGRGLADQQGQGVSVRPVVAGGKDALQFAGNAGCVAADRNSGPLAGEGAGCSTGLFTGAQVVVVVSSRQCARVAGSFEMNLGLRCGPAVVGRYDYRCFQHLGIRLDR
ncbi:hypothetical protein D3C76_977280 [compost metagenome]